jgi:hypothetical protein
MTDKPSFQNMSNALEKSKESACVYSCVDGFVCRVMKSY